jgi:hypothetical protein
MKNIEKNEPTNRIEIEDFLSEISFTLPKGFIEFYIQSNGAEVNSEEFYTILWPLSDMLPYNISYQIEKYAPEFFIFGTDGGDTAFVIEKTTGKIFEMPFIGMSTKEAIFIADSFNDFLETR